MKTIIPRLVSAALAIALTIGVPVPAGAADPVRQPGAEELKVILADFDAYAEKAMAEWKVPGMAVAVVRGDDVLYEKAFGVKELGKPDPVNLDTVFQIGSASKAFTSALVAQLVDEGKVKWDDRVASHLGDFTMCDPWVTGEFTVTDLMAQRSGMAAHALDSLVMMGFGRQRVIDSLRFVKPATSFRSAYAYQNNLWLIAAKLVEKYTGKTWEENVSQRIFGPLGMLQSSCDKKSFVTGENVATLHHDVNGKIVILPMSWQYMDWVYTYGPAGGVNSNVKDMVKWVRMQAADGAFEGKQFIKEENVKYMHAPKTAIAGSTDPDQFYCLGWVRREASPYPIIWHNGGTSGSKTMVAFIPQAKLGIVVVSNLIDTTLPEALAFRFFDMYFGNPERDWSSQSLVKAKEAAAKEKAEAPREPDKPFPPMALYRYAGDYSNDFFGNVTVSKKGDDLILTVGPKKTELKLRHWDRDTFMASWGYYGVREDAGLVAFKLGPAKEVVGLTADVFNEDSCGEFRKECPRPGTEPASETIPLFDQFEKMYGAARIARGVREIGYNQFLQLRKSGEKFILVDVLSSDDYGTGHIDGAISFPLKTINKETAASKIPPGSQVVVYCLDIKCPLSVEAAQRLTSYGYKVLAYKGGLDEWQQKGHKLAR